MEYVKKLYIKLIMKIIYNMDINSFKHKFCINLERRKDRLKETLLEFEKNDILDVEIIKAIDSKYYYVDDISINKGAYCLTLTIKQLIERAKEENYSEIVIFEDDVVFVDNFQELSSKYLIEIFNELNDWDMIYFGVNNINPPIKIKKNINKLTKSVSSHFFIIRNTMYDNILKMINKEGKIKQIDLIYSDFHKNINAYTHNPAICFQRKGYSDIENKIVKKYVC